MTSPTYALPIVVRVEKSFNITAEDAYKATIQAVAEFLTLQSESQELIHWLNSDYRKITRRARGAKWDAIEARAVVIKRVGDAEIAVLPLYDVNDTPEDLRKLQVSGLELPSQSAHVDKDTQPGVMKVYINRDVHMSTGKVIAQMGHAAQIISHKAPDETKTWLDSGMPVSIQNKTPDEDTIDVIDNGLTEIPAGTVTIKVWF